MTAPALRTCLRRTATSSLSYTRTTRLLTNSPEVLTTLSQRLRSFSSCPKNFQELQDFQAAPEIDLNDVYNHPVPLLERIRIVPKSPAYFSGRPDRTDAYLEVLNLFLKYKTLPSRTNPIKISWLPGGKSKSSIRAKGFTHKRLIRMLEKLGQIDPIFMPAEVPPVLEKHKTAIQPQEVVPKKVELDEWGRSLGVGRRKTSTAKAYLVEGEGEVLVNGRSLVDMFGRLHDRESALWALKSTNRMDKYNVFAIVKGGGVTGQAEAMTLAVAKALIVHEPALKPALRRAGCVTRDPRTVERKKAGHLKARKKPAWVKR